MLVVDETFLNGSQAIAGSNMPDPESSTVFCYPEESNNFTCVNGDDGKFQRMAQELHGQVGDIQNRSTSFEVLDNRKCIDEYSQSLHSSRRHLLAITRQRTNLPLQYHNTSVTELTRQRTKTASHYNRTGANDSTSWKQGYNVYDEENDAQICSDSEVPCLRILKGSLINFWSLTMTIANLYGDNQTYDSSAWMCSSDSEPDFQQDDGSCVPGSLDPNEWKVNAQPIEYCRSEIVEEKCRLEFSSTIGIVVIICNSVKLAVLIFTATSFDQRTLCTIGYVIPLMDSFHLWLTKPGIQLHLSSMNRPNPGCRTIM